RRLLAWQLPAGAGRRRGLVQPRLPCPRGAGRFLGGIAGANALGVAFADGFGRDQRPHRLPRGAGHLRRRGQCAWKLATAGRAAAVAAWAAAFAGSSCWGSWPMVAATTCPARPPTPTPARRC